MEGRYGEVGFVRVSFSLKSALFRPGVSAIPRRSDRDLRLDTLIVALWAQSGVTTWARSRSIVCFTTSRHVTIGHGKCGVHCSYSSRILPLDSPKVSVAGRKIKDHHFEKVMWTLECTSKVNSPARPGETSMHSISYRRSCASS